MNQKEELILEILSSVDVIKGKTKFVKILHFVCKLFEKHKMKSPFSYRPDKFGVYFPQLELVLDDLKKQGMIQVNISRSIRQISIFLKDPTYQASNSSINELGLEIRTLVKTLNSYSADDVIAFSYYTFPDTTGKSEIKPKINERITTMFSEPDPDIKESSSTIIGIKSGVEALSPQYNDLDMRKNMMKSLGMSKIPPIIPDSIDELSGIIYRETSILKNYNLEEMLENTRRR